MAELINRFATQLCSSNLGTVKSAPAKSLPKPRKAGTPRGKTARSKFWVRPASKELNRTGDFILKHLPSIRREAASRAGLA